PTPAAAYGIYLDDNSSGVEVSGNTVGNVVGKGLYIHNARNIVVRNNTLYNNGVQMNISHDNLGNPVRNATISNNILFAATIDQLTASYNSVKNDLAQIGNVDANYYVRPLDDIQTITSRYYDNNKVVSSVHDLEAWKKAFNKDGASKKSPLTHPAYRIENLSETNLFPNGTFDNQTMATYGVHGSSSENSWLSNGKLDGGSMQVKTKGKSSSLTMRVSALKANTHYVLRFKAIASKKAVVRTVMMQSNTPWATVAPKAAIELTQQEGQYEVVFPIKEAQSMVSIRFEVEDEMTFWLDNVGLYEAQVKPTKPDDVFRFEYNSGKTNKTVSLDGTYVDVKNKQYSGNVTLAPFSSLVLIRKELQAERPTPAPTVEIVSPKNNE